jgi:hypothetical protein
MIEQRSSKPRFHIDERNIPYTQQPEATQTPTHVLGEDGSLKPIVKEDAKKFKPSDAVPMDWGTNYSSI